MPKLIVVDASVSVKWGNPKEKDADKARLMLLDYRRGALSFATPAFWDYELASGLVKAVVRHDLSADKAAAVLRTLRRIKRHIEPTPSPEESMMLAQQYERGVYDSWYLALAEQLRCEFWTADEKLYNAVKDRLNFVKLLSNYQSQP